MSSRHKTAIIVPCYNESARLNREEFINTCDLFEDIEFVFVNDCSEDDTGLILQELHKNRYGQIFIVNLSENSGKAEAVRQGVRFALKRNYAYIGYWDADLATPLSNIKIFIDKLDDCPDLDIVMGARVKLLGRSISRLTSRHYLGRLFATCASMVLRLPVYDTQCGAKLFRNTPLFSKVFEEPYKTGWIFDVELLARYIAMGNTSLQQITAGKIFEYPLESWTHIPGSKIGIKDYLLSGFDLLRIWMRYGNDIKRLSKQAINS